MQVLGHSTVKVNQQSYTGASTKLQKAAVKSLLSIRIIGDFRTMSAQIYLTGGWRGRKLSYFQGRECSSVGRATAF